ncbi:MAG: alpha-E domain-containing protein [Actinomycetota bacterium]|nr:MAG: alpha-E domain-containing protein [Actinomycetota bacterium]
MLSRIAESFFWIGRYVERAEATARLLAEHHQLLVEDRTVNEDVACAVLLDALSMPHVDVNTGTALVRALVGGPTEPATITGSVTAARENARAIRDALSGDVFEALNATHLALTRGTAFAASPGVALYRVLDRLLVVHGVIEWTMSRDEGYLFLALGRSLERIDMTARMLCVRHDQLWPQSGPVATLRAAGALSAFLRTRNPLQGNAVRAFLVVDGTFPRSMRVAAHDAEEAVRGLERAGSTDGGDLLREVGMLRSLLEYTVDPGPAEIDGLAEHAQVAIERASDVVSSGFFRQAGTIVWSH